MYISTMATVVLIGIPVMFITVMVVGRLREKARKRAELAHLQAPTLAWLKKTEGLTQTQLAKLEAPPENCEKVGVPGIERAVDDYSHAVLKVERMAHFSNLFAQALEIIDPVEQYRALKNIDLSYLTDEQKMMFEDIAPHATHAVGELLHNMAQQGDYDAFLKLREMLLERRHWSFYSRDTTAKSLALLSPPSDWNDLVVRFFQNPHLSDFEFINKDVPSNAVLHMATEALRTRSLVLAKVVLAFCAVARWHGNSSSHPYRNEIGYVLLAEIATMVDTLHVERGLFQDSPSVSDTLTT